MLSVPVQLSVDVVDSWQDLRDKSCHKNQEPEKKLNFILEVMHIRKVSNWPTALFDLFKGLWSMNCYAQYFKIKLKKIATNKEKTSKQKIKEIQIRS